jgi:hypothetical protein
MSYAKIRAFDGIICMKNGTWHLVKISFRLEMKINGKYKCFCLTN